MSITERRMAKFTSPFSRKRSLEYDDVSAIEAPDSKAKVHDIVSSLSPLKPNAKRPYFEGSLTDGTKSMRFVGFRIIKRL